MTKRALVVGINDYQNWQRARGLVFPQLHWCLADANAFATLLNTSFGFATDDVILCQDNEATLEALLGGLTNLLSVSQPGDVACFYFAGHGGRVPEHTVRAENRRYYETIVPYDNAGMIFDYQLASLTQALLTTQVNFTVILDTAHAGGIRSFEAGTTARSFTWGGDMINQFVASANSLIPLTGLADPTLLNGNISQPATMGNGVTVNIHTAKDFVGQAAAVLLSACNYNEVAGESDNLSHGYLTNALLETANQANFQVATTDLLAQLRNKVATYTGGKQTPQLRGRPLQAQEIFLEGFPPTTA